MFRILEGFLLNFIGNNIFLQKSKEKTNKTTLNDSQNTDYGIKADACRFSSFRFHL